MKLRSLYLLMLFVLTIGCNNQQQSAKVTPPEEHAQVVMYFTRHGKTLFNTMDRVQGWADSPLTPAGVTVAEFLGKGLQDTAFVAVYTSDSGRARETADLVMHYNKHSQDVRREETKDLREWFFGSFEGDYNSVMMAAIMKASGISSKEGIFAMSIPIMADAIAVSDTTRQAEDWEAIKTRVNRAIEKIAHENAGRGGGNVLVVCHGLTISAIAQLVDPAQAKPGLENASVTKVVYKDGVYSLASFNDMRYVDAGKK